MIVDKPHGRTPRKHADPKLPDGLILGVTIVALVIVYTAATLGALWTS